MSKIDLSAERLRELLHYDPETGLFRRRTNQRRWKAGSLSGWQTPNGYVMVLVSGEYVMAHRLAWLYMTGTLPEADIDHINGSRKDNRFSNLRSATRSVNQQNLRAARSHNKSGLLGVSPHGTGWRAQIAVDHKRFHIGTYRTPEDAHAAYLKAKQKLHPGSTI